MSAKQEFLDRVQRWLIVDAISIRNIKQNRRSWKLRCKIRAEAWLLQMIRSFIIQQQLRISKVRSISGIWVQICCSLVTCNTHPSWMGHLPKIVTREVVYYILTRTPRAPQKCYWSGLRVEFSGENHLFLICGKMPNQTWWITKYLDLGLNSDLFKKKKIPNRTCLDCFR